jgi:ribonuclease HI
LQVTRAYPDGSTDKHRSKAGFGIYFPELPSEEAYKNLSSRIPESQSIARAEGFGVLAALLLAKRDTALTVHCDRKPLVGQINRFRYNKPQQHDLRRIKDASLLLRILKEIEVREGQTNIVHVKAHMRDHPTRLRRDHDSATSLTETETHQEHNNVADEVAKASLLEATPQIPDETEKLAPLTILLDGSKRNGTNPIFENNPLHLYQQTYKETRQIYHFKGK